MRQLLLLTTLAGTLAACGGPSTTPEQRAQAAANAARTDAAVQDAKSTVVGANTFRVAVVQDGPYALVERVGGSAPYTAGDAETAARSATGCAAAFSPGILAFLSGDVRTADLAALRTKISGKFSGWRVDLTC